MNLNVIKSDMEHKIVQTFVDYVQRKMPSDDAVKGKKSPSETSKLHKFKDMFGSHHDLKKLVPHPKRKYYISMRFGRN